MWACGVCCVSVGLMPTCADCRFFFDLEGGEGLSVGVGLCLINPPDPYAVSEDETKFRPFTHRELTCSKLELRADV